MTRMKKARSPGQIGSRKEGQETAEQSKNRKRKAKRHGLAAGSRQNVAELNPKHTGSKAAQDPRLGSKKPISLLPESAKPKAEKSSKPAKKQQSEKAIAEDVFAEQAPNVSTLTIEQELEQLENDERLNTLLDKVDAGEKLNKNDASWLDKTLARHQQILEELGLLEDDDEESTEGGDLWSRFMDTELDPAQYEDKEDKS